MIPAPTLEALLASPAGHYLAASHSLSFIVDPHVVGVVVWGSLDRDLLLRLLRSHEQMRPALSPPTSAIVDVRYLDWPDPSAFTTLVEYVAERRDWLAEYIERLALVRPVAGPVGAATAGFFQVSSRPFAVSTFVELAEALRWTGRRDGDAIGRQLEGAVASASQTPPALRKLRELLDALTGTSSVSGAARQLGMSERSLQRLLQACGTSFKAEQNAAQVRVAQRLLQHTDTALAQIAGAVGCASPAHFSALFRRITGETPSEWRARMKPGDGELRGKAQG